MELISNPEVAKIYTQYPRSVRDELLCLRQLIIDTAAESEKINKLEETLKWGQPAYVTKNGSTIRIDWKNPAPDQYAMYFHCKTHLIETFKELYATHFKFEGNRAIVFKTGGKLPVSALKHCILMSLTYHSIKHLPLLGA